MPLAPPPPPLRLATRPLGAGALAVALGIATARGFPGVGVLAWSTLVGLATLGAAAYALHTRRRLVTLRAFVLAIAVLAAAFATGGARYATLRVPPPTDVGHTAAAALHADVARDDRAPITLWGTVLDTPTARAWSVRFAAAVDSAARGSARGPLTGRVQVSLLTPDEARPVYPALRLGDRIRLTGRLEPPPPPRNPAQMDYGAYLQGQGIHATLRVEGETNVDFLAPSTHIGTRGAVAIQRRVRRALARHVPDADARAVLLALLLADRSQIDEATLEGFRGTGLMHLLAVSGLHVGLVGLAVYALLKPGLGRLGWSRRRVEWGRAIVTLAVLAVYAGVTGGSVSVVRAGVMAAVLILGRTLERPVDTLNTLGGAALLLLLHRPAALFEVGFQLSFGAVAALVTLVPLLTSAVPDRARQSKAGAFVVGSVVASLAATLGTAPILLAHFGRLPLGSLVLNLPAIPLTAVTLGGGLGVSLCAGWFPLAAETFGALAELGARALLWTSRAGASGLEWATIEGVLDDPMVLAALGAGVLALALWRRPLARLRVALAAGALLLGSLWAGVLSGESRPRLDAVFLDVGQGDATLLSLPSGRHVLVDAGLRSPYVDEGTRTLLPHLDRFGIDRLDALVLTHADADHIGGAVAVLEGVTVGRLVTNGQAGASGLWASVIRAADSLAVPVTAVAAGDTLDLDPDVRLRVLGPAGPVGSSNDASVVLRVEYGRTRWLLTGDAEAPAEAALVGRYRAALAADVVKVGHHGSRTSSTPALVAAAGRPAFAVVSVARRNRYGLPNAEPLARWDRTGAQTLLTSTEGAVWLRSDGDRVWRVGWR